MFEQLIKNGDNQCLYFDIDGVSFTFLISRVTPYIPSQKDMIHSHMYYEILFTMPTDRLCVSINEKTVEVNETSIILIHPNTRHYVINSLSSTFCSISIKFKKNNKQKNSDLYNRLFSSFDANEYIILNQNDFVSAILRDLMLYYDNNFINKNYLLTVKCFELLLCIHDCVSNKNAEQMRQKNKVLNFSPYFYIDTYINKNISNTNITLQTLSKELHLSISQINRIIKNETGLSFKQYLISIRLNNALNLLKNTNLKIIDIANNIGYNSPHGFHVIFKKTFGCSPEHYRKQYNKEVSE